MMPVMMVSLPLSVCLSVYLCIISQILTILLLCAVLNFDFAKFTVLVVQKKKIAVFLNAVLY